MSSGATTPWRAVLVVSLTVAVSSAVLAWVASPLRQSQETTGGVKYEPVSPGVQAATLLRTDALRDVTVEVKDFIVGPGKSAPQMPTQGFAVTELKAGEVETTLDGQVAKRRPGEFWLVRPGQQYAVKSLGGMAVLHATIFIRP